MVNDPLANTNPPVDAPPSPALNPQGAAGQSMSLAAAQALFNSGDFEDSPLKDEARALIVASRSAATAQAPLAAAPEEPMVDLETPLILGQPAPAATAPPETPPVAPAVETPVVLTKAQQLVAMLASGVEETAAVRALYSDVVAPAAQAAPVPDVPIIPPPAQAALTAWEEEYARKKVEMEDAKYDDEATNRIHLEIGDLIIKGQRLINAADREQDNLAWQAEQQQANAEKAEWDGVVNRIPDFKVLDGPQMKAFGDTYAQLARVNPAFFQQPQWRTNLVELVLAANPSLATQPAAPATPPAHQVPPAQPVTQFAPPATPGATPAPVIDVSNLTADQLEEMAIRDPQRHAAIRNATYAALQGRHQ